MIIYGGKVGGGERVHCRGMCIDCIVYRLHTSGR